MINRSLHSTYLEYFVKQHYGIYMRCITYKYIIYNHIEQISRNELRFGRRKRGSDENYIAIVTRVHPLPVTESAHSRD